MNFLYVSVWTFAKINLSLGSTGFVRITYPATLSFMIGCVNTYSQLIRLSSSITNALFIKSFVYFPIFTSKGKLKGLFMIAYL